MNTLQAQKRPHAEGFFPCCVKERNLINFFLSKSVMLVLGVNRYLLWNYLLFIPHNFNVKVFAQRHWTQANVSRAIEKAYRKKKTIQYLQSYTVSCLKHHSRIQRSVVGYTQHSDLISGLLRTYYPLFILSMPISTFSLNVYRLFLLLTILTLSHLIPFPSVAHILHLHCLLTVSRRPTSLLLSFPPSVFITLLFPAVCVAQPIASISRPDVHLCISYE